MMSMICWANLGMRVSLPAFDFWRPKIRTASAMAQLCWAQFLISWIAFSRWRGSLGCLAEVDRPTDLTEARQLAADVDWAARRIPFRVKCLPQAMALSRLLRHRQINHAVVIAVRPDQLRQSPDALHAWVEIKGETIFGDLPGPWIETMRIGTVARPAV